MQALAYAVVVHDNGYLKVVALGITEEDARRGLRDWWPTQRNRYQEGTVVRNHSGRNLSYPPPETATLAEMNDYFTGVESFALYQIAVVPVGVIYNAGKQYGGT